MFQFQQMHEIRHAFMPMPCFFFSLLQFTLLIISLNCFCMNVQETYARYVKEYYIGTFGATVSTYDQQYLKNTTPDETGN